MVRVLTIALLTLVRLKTSSASMSEVVADWYELMIPRRIMRPSIVLNNEQLDPRYSKTYHRTQSVTLNIYTVARELLHVGLPISRSAEGRRLSWPEHTVNQQHAQCCRVTVTDYNVE